MSSLIANRSKSIPNVIRFVNRCPKFVCTQDKREPFGIADSTSEDFPTKARQPRKGLYTFLHFCGLAIHSKFDAKAVK